MIHRSFWFGILALGSVLVLDMVTKWWMLHTVLTPARPAIEVTPFFNLVLVWNRGISFGLFSEHNQPIALSALALAVVTMLAGWLWRSRSVALSLALGSVIGGAIGNVADRLRFGAVVDFLDFHVMGYHWPAFNVADSAIFIGVVVLCAHSMLVPDHRH